MFATCCIMFILPQGTEKHTNISTSRPISGFPTHKINLKHLEYETGCRPLCTPLAVVYEDVDNKMQYTTSPSSVATSRVNFSYVVCYVITYRVCPTVMTCCGTEMKSLSRSCSRQLRKSCARANKCVDEHIVCTFENITSHLKCLLLFAKRLVMGVLTRIVDKDIRTVDRLVINFRYTGSVYL
jgi:hypothetical protein